MKVGVRYLRKVGRSQNKIVRAPREETGSLQVANAMRHVLLNVSLHVLVIKSLQETQ